VTALHGDETQRRNILKAIASIPEHLSSLLCMFNEKYAYLNVEKEGKCLK
jgi:hypothetical protein